MKKLFTLTLALLAGTLINAQTITGGDMESFHPVQIAGTHPTLFTQGQASWWGLDSFAISMAASYLDTATGAPFAAQVAPQTGHTGQGVKLTTKIEDTLGVTSSVISNCKPTLTVPPVTAMDFFNNLTFTGGTALTAAQRPSKIGAWVKYVPVSGDTAHVMVKVLDAANNVIGTGDSIITSNDASFHYVAPRITYSNTAVAAKLQVMIMSSPLGHGRGQDGSVLYADDVAYILASAVEETTAAEKVVKFGPNPTTGIVYLYCNVSDKLSWQVFNTTGQVVVNKELTAANREDLSYMPAGTYFYNILNNKGDVLQKDKFTIVK